MMMRLHNLSHGTDFPVRDIKDACDKIDDILQLEFAGFDAILTSGDSRIVAGIFIWHSGINCHEWKRLQSG